MSASGVGVSAVSLIRIVLPKTSMSFVGMCGVISSSISRNASRFADWSVTYTAFVRTVMSMSTSSAGSGKAVFCPVD